MLIPPTSGEIGIESGAVPSGWIEEARAMAIDLAFIWAALLAFAVLLYVILDGFDLGVGVLFLFFKKESPGISS